MQAMRLSLAVACLAALTVAGVAAGGPTAAPKEINVWAGQWQTTSKYGTGFALRALSVQAGFRAADDLHLERCYPPTTYYRGAYYDPISKKGGKIAGCTEGAWSFKGRYLGDPAKDPGAKGRIEIEFQLPNRFTGFFTPDGSTTKYDYAGFRKAHFEDGAFSPLVVNFAVRVSGKPNLGITGVPAIASGTIRTAQPSHATFTKYNAKSPEVLEATETKGRIDVDLVGTDGKKRHYEFGIISQTGYSTRERRLALLLRTEASNDPSCPVSKSGAILYLLPTYQGLRDTAILFGIPFQQTIEVNIFFEVLKERSEPCKGLGYGWQNGDAGVHVSTRLAETVPGAEG